MGWWIALAVVIGLAVLPLGVSVRYRGEGLWLAVLAGPVRIRLLPAKKKKKKPAREKRAKKVKGKKQKPAAPQQKKAPAQPQREAKSAQPPEVDLAEKYPDVDKKPGRIPPKLPEPEKEQGGSWKDFLTLVPIVLDFLGDFRRKLRVDRLELKLILASDDPCDLAINYGKAWTAVGNLLPQLQRVFVIRKRNVEVECDFTASETRVIARMDLTITLGRLLAVVCKFAFHALVEYFKIMKKRKGGAAK